MKYFKKYLITLAKITIFVIREDTSFKFIQIQSFVSLIKVTFIQFIKFRSKIGFILLEKKN